MKIKKRILVIGDDLTFFQSAKDFMANSSTEVSYAMSVKEALNYLLSSEYCIVIICIPLSVDSSIEFLRLVRETYLMPILVITPKLRVSEKVALFHAGANTCLELLSLPRYVYPACLIVFGYPSEQQKNRKKPERFCVSDPVCENSYRDKSSRKIREMFDGKTDGKSYEEWMEAFWKRKYESDFSREMNRSMAVYLKDFEN